MPRWAIALNLSSRLEPDRISWIVIPTKATYAAFRKEGRAKFANATKPDKKSG
jgi:hypothetical protein